MIVFVNGSAVLVYATDAFVGRLCDGNNEGMKTKERCQGPSTGENERPKENCHNHGDPSQDRHGSEVVGKDIVVCVVIGRMECFLISRDKESNDSGGNQNGKESNVDEEKEKVSMIAFSYTISHPGTVMIKFGNTNVATIAVFGSWWSENVACGAISISTGSAERNAVVGDGCLFGRRNR